MQLATILGSKGRAVLTIHPEASVAGLVAMLTEHSVGALVVSPDGAIISGIVSERDVVRSLMHGSAVLDAPDPELDAPPDSACRVAMCRHVRPTLSALADDGPDLVLAELVHPDRIGGARHTT